MIGMHRKTQKYLPLKISPGPCASPCGSRPSGSNLHKSSSQVFYIVVQHLEFNSYIFILTIPTKIHTHTQPPQLPQCVVQPVQLPHTPGHISASPPRGCPVLPSYSRHLPAPLLHPCLWPPGLALQRPALQRLACLQRRLSSLRRLPYNCLQHPCLCPCRGGGGVSKYYYFSEMCCHRLSE